jgi:hypothetical protein
MAIPNHDSSCVTKSYEATCQYCKRQVWFVSCSCGSKIFFDDRGYPWEKHYCQRYFIKNALDLVHNAGRLSTQEIWTLIQKHEKGSGLQLDDTLLDVIESITGPAKYPFKSVEMLASDYKVVTENEVEFSGQVIEISHQVNVAKFLGYSKSPLAEKLIARVAPGEWIRIVVRTKPDRRNEARSYSILVPADLWRRNKIYSSSSISGVLTRGTHPNGAFWILANYQLH